MSERTTAIQPRTRSRRRIASLAVPVCVALLLAFAGGEAMAAKEYEPNDSLGSAYGPLVGGKDYVAGIETLNDEDWYVFYVKTYSQFDIATTMVKQAASFNRVSLNLFDKDGMTLRDAQSAFSPGPSEKTNHFPITLSPGRYYLRVRSGSADPGDRYRFRIDPAASLTDSRECGEAIVRKETAVPLLADVQEDLAEKGEKLAVKAAAVHKAKKKQRRASEKIKRLKGKVKHLQKRLKGRGGNHRLEAKLERATDDLRRAKRGLKRAQSMLDAAKAARRPIWSEKRKLDRLASQHQEIISSAEGQIATFC